MNTLYIVCGPAGCGKSTFIHNLCRDYMRDAAIVSRDEIRFNLLSEGDSYFAKEKEVYATFAAVIGKSLEYGDVFADATHLTPKSRKCLLDEIKKTNPLTNVILSAIYFSEDFCIENCYKRNAERTGRAFVPNKVITNMINSYVPPTLEEGFAPIYMISEHTDIELISKVIAGELY